MSNFEKDSDCIAYALEGWANHIETGNITLCRDDVIRMVKDSRRDGLRAGHTLFDAMKPLTDDQMTLVARLRALAKKARET